MVKELANDVTVSGQMEPTAYVTEIFAGDGTTTVFTLSDEPFRPTRQMRSLLISDSFNQAVFNTQTLESSPTPARIFARRQPA
jgi:hypothetical protein